MDPWSQAIVGALQSVRSSVVHVTAKDAKNQGLTFGSGLVLDPYHVVTTAQIVGLGDEVTVTVGEGRNVKAECLGVDPLYFLAVCRVESRMSAEPLKLASLEELAVGQIVLAVGNPFGTDHTVSMGVLSALDRTVYRPERFPVDGLLVTDARLHPGNTGGALVDLEGRLVGVNGIPWVHGLSLAVQAQVMARITNQMIDWGEATHPWLGFSGEPEVLDRTWVDLFSLSVDRGLMVEVMADDGPGRRAGVAEGDLVVRSDGKMVTTVGSIRRALALHRPGDRVPLTVLRGGDLIDLTITVEQMPNLGQVQAEEESE